MSLTISGGSGSGRAPAVSDRVFDDNADMFTKYGIRPGKFGPDTQRYLGISLYPGAFAQGNFASGLEPARQNQLGNYLSWLSAGNTRARTDRTTGAIVNQGAGQAQQIGNELTARGMSPEMALAAKLALRGRALRDANLYQSGEDGRIAEGYQLALQAITEGQKAPMIDQLMQILIANEQARQQSQNRKAAGQASQGLGGFAGLAGTIAGGMDWDAILRGV